MKKSLMGKCISTVLAVSLLFQMFSPSIVVAKELIEDNNKNEEVTKNTEPTGKIIGELEEKRESNVKYFLRDDNTFEAAYYAYDVHYLEDGKYKDINNKLEKKYDYEDMFLEVYENKNNKFKVKFKKDLNNNYIYKLKENDYEIAYSLKNIERSAGEISLTNKKSDDPKNLNNIFDKIVYKNVYSNNIDLSYLVMPNGVKEDIVISSKTDRNQFIYEIDTKNLTLTLTDNIIYLKDENSEKTVYVMNAPYMYDANNEISTDIKFELNGKNGKYEVTMSLPSKWMNSTDRKYPIVVDPIVSTNISRDYIMDSHVSQGYPTTNYLYSYILKTGYGSSSYINRTFIAFSNLPTLNTGDMIINAYLQLSLGPAFYDNHQVSVHKVTSDWSSSTITWNNQPSYDSTAIDYETITGSQYSYQTWDITSIAKEWYAYSANRGLMIRESGNEGLNYTEYYSSDQEASLAAYRPSAVFQYINNSGLESYWTYHSQDIGRAGTGYVNDYNGNLIFVHNDLSIDGKTPISINHVFNSNTRNINTFYGNGWRINYHQTLELVTISGINYYKYIDEDGTEIYLKNSGTNTYVDELGLHIQLIVNPSSSTERYVITDKTGNRLIFDTSLRLYKIKEVSGKEINITYNTLGSIKKIIDASGRITTLNYDINNLLGEIISPDNKSTKYYYTYDKRLVKIVYPDNKYITYNYDEVGNMLNIKDIDNQILSYKYYNTNPYRIKSISKDYQLYKINSSSSTGTVAATRLEGTTNQDFEYLMFGGSDASRFGYVALSNGNSNYFIGVVHSNGKWYYDNNGGLTEFAPNANDRIMGHFYRHNTTVGLDGIDNYISNDNKIHGVNIGGNYTGAIEINKSGDYSCSSSANAGEIRIAGGTFVHPNGNTYSVGCGEISTTLEGTVYDTGYIMFVGTDLSRFYNRYGKLTGFMFVKYDNGWKYDDNGYAWNAFTPNANDSIVGVVHRNTTTSGITKFDSWLGYNNTIFGIKKSCEFNSAIELNKDFVGMNYGEIFVKNGDFKLDGYKKGLYLDITYGYNETIYTDYKGNKNYYQFNNQGNTILVKDNEGRTNYYKYNNLNINQLDVSSKLQTTIINKLKDHNFEASSTWSESIWAGATGSSSFTTEQAYIGNKSMKIDMTNDEYGYFRRQILTLEKGKTYNFSIYGKVTRINNPDVGGAIILVYTKDLNGTWQMQLGPTIKQLSDWEKLNMIFTVPADSTTGEVIIQFGMYYTAGTAYFDNAQVEKDEVSNRYNLIENNDFSFGTATPDFFTKTGTVSSTDTITANNNLVDVIDDNVYKIDGVPTQNKGLSQTVNVKGSKNDTFVFGGWSKADSISLTRTNVHETREYKIKVTINHTDGSNNSTFVSFNPDTSEWQYISDVIIATEDYSSVTYEILYNRNLNTAYFDGLQLYREAFGSTYKYDSNGNITSTSGVDNNGMQYTYTNNDVAQIITSEGNNYNYSYDPYHRLTKMVTPSNVSTFFTYDNNGNLIKTRVEGASLFIESQLEYDPSGNYVTKETDSRGNVIKYNYNNANGNLNSVTNPNDIITKYLYNDINRLTSVTQDDKTINYTYNNDYLTQVDASGLQYQFVYDELGNQTEVKVNGNSLIKRNYQVDGTINTGRLDSIEYGNGDKVSTVYDQYNRVKEIYIDDVKRFEYKYDNSNNLVESYDINRNVRTYYNYDLLGRLTNIKLSNSDEIKFIYNQYNKIEQIIEKYGTNYYSVNYEYDNENRIVNMHFNELPNISDIEYFPLSSNTSSLSGIKSYEDSSSYKLDSYGNKVLDKTISNINKIDLNISKNSGSFSGWININSSSTDRIVIGNATTDAFINLYVNSNNKLELRIKKNSDNTNYTLVESPINIPANEWIFVGAKWNLNGSTLEGNIYVNGNVTSGSSTDFKDFTMAITSFGINLNNQELLNGLMSHITHSNRALTGDEFNDLYEFGRGKNIEYKYDELGRLNKKILHTNTITTEESYTFIDGNSSSETTLIESVNEKVISSSGVEIINETTHYEYDKLGNISKIIYSDNNTSTYKYDNLNQLIEEINSKTNEKITYEYEGIGNIKKVIKENITAATDGIKKEYRYINADGTWSNWIKYNDVNEINYTNINLPKIPNLGTKGGLYDLDKYNVNYSILNGEDKLNFNGINSKASSRNYLEFNGINSYVSLPPINVNDTDEITLTAKIYWNGDTQDKSSGSDRGTIIVLIYSYYLQLMSDGRIAVYTFSDGAESVYDYSVNKVPANEWVDIAFTEKNGLRKIYINGILDNTIQRESTIRYYNSNTEIGAQNSATSRYFNGKINEATIWNRELSLSDINDLNSNGLPSNKSNLKAYYTFDGKNGTLFDQSGNNNNGTILNTIYPIRDVTNDSYLVFDGLTTGVTGTKIEVNETDEVTLYADIYWDGSAQGSGRGNIISKTGSYYMQLMDDGKIAVYTYHDGGDSLYDYSISSIPLNQWVKVAFTEKAGLRKIYINGVLDNTIQRENTIRTYNSVVEIGMENNIRYFKGKIREVQVWDKGLTEVEINNLATTHPAKDAPGLRAYYNFIGYGTVLTDYSIHQEHGKLINLQYPKKYGFDVKTIYMELDTIDYTNPTGSYGVPISFDGNEFVWNPLILEIDNDNYVQKTNDLVPVGEKYKLAITWNGSNYEFYINGTKYNSNIYSGTPSIINATEVILGYLMNQNGYYYYGGISDVRLSSNVLTEQQAINITSTTPVDGVLNKNNTEVVYNFIEYREVPIKENATLIGETNYTYDTNWKDQLKEVDGYQYTYDEIGNPIKIEKDGVTYRTFTWEKGRQLASMYVYRGDLGFNDIDVYYKYDENGIRVEKKIVDKVTLTENITTYKISGDKIIEETNGTNKLHYIYDAEGTIVAVTLNNETYYYEKNITGDIIGLIDESGTRVVSYTYDSWGKIITLTDTSNIDLGIINPFRYRGYFYDTETGYYYLNSRYYNPDVKRFINADGTMGEVGNIIGNNMYAYAGNNPINLQDETGNWPKWIKKAVQGTAIIIGAALITAAVVASAPAIGALAGMAVLSAGVTSGAIFTAAVTVSTVATYGVAAATLAIGLSNAGEAFTGTNIIKDKLMGGNQNLYDKVQTGVGIASTGIITIGVMYNTSESRKGNPLANVRYTEKVINDMSKEDNHGFPNIVDNYGAYGRVSSLVGGDEITRTLVQIPGSYRNRIGVFEYIIEPGGIEVNHRYFRSFK